MVAAGAMITGNQRRVHSASVRFCLILMLTLTHGPTSASRSRKDTADIGKLPRPEPIARTPLIYTGVATVRNQWLAESSQREGSVMESGRKDLAAEIAALRDALDREQDRADQLKA